MPRSPLPKDQTTFGEVSFGDALAHLGEAHEHEVAGLRARNAELAAIVRRLSREFSQVQTQNLQIKNRFKEFALRLEKRSKAGPTSALASSPARCPDPLGPRPRSSISPKAARAGGDETEGDLADGFENDAGADEYTVDEIDLAISPEGVDDVANAACAEGPRPDCRAGRASNISCVSCVSTMVQPSSSATAESLECGNGRESVTRSASETSRRVTITTVATGDGPSNGRANSTRLYPSSCMKQSLVDLVSMSSRASVSSRNTLSLFTLREAWQVSDQKLENLRKRRTKACGVSSSGKRLSVHNWMTSKSMSGLFENNGGIWKHFLTLQTYVVHPQSRLRVFWNVVGMMFVLYDLFIIPMQLFDLPPSSFQSHVRWTCAVFWTLDVVLSFFTGAYDKAGQLEMRPGEIAKIYAKTWLVFDIAVLVLEWVFIGLGEGTASDVAGGGGMIYLRVLRFLRFLRLMRVVRLERAMMDVRERINSSYVLIFIGLFRVIVGIIILNHILACVWFAIGRTNDGWASDFHHPPGEVPEFTLLYGYLTAVHWAVTQFHGTMEVFPKNAMERGFAVFVVLSALLGFSSFLSTITNMMRQLQILRDERTRETQMVRKFLRDNHISARLGVRVKKWVECKQGAHMMQECDVDVLKMLPAPMLMDLHEEMRSSFLEKHPFFTYFRDMFGRIVRRICHDAMHPIAASYSEIVFTTGDASGRMYFVTSGSLSYELGGGCMGSENGALFSGSSSRTMRTVGSAEHALEQMHKQKLSEGQVCSKPGLSRGAWLSEAALWIADWEHQGELGAVTACQLVVMDAPEFARIVKSHATATGAAVDYARYFLNFLNYADTQLSDVLYEFPSQEDCQTLFFPLMPQEDDQSNLSP